MKERNDEYQGDWGDSPRVVFFAGNGNGPTIDLDWADFGNYRTDSEVEQYLQNYEQTQGYEELRNQTDVEVFRSFAEDQILRDR